MASQRYDAIVIGGGVVGASIAYHAVRAGLRVLLLDKDEFLAGTSGATFAWVGAHFKKPTHYNLFSQEAVRLYKGLEAELGTSIEHDVVGSIELVETEAELHRVDEEVEALRAEGFDLVVLPGEEIRRREPIVPESFAGGVYSPNCAMVNPFRTVMAYLARARELGAEVRHGVEVRGILRAAGRVEGVATDQGEFRADWVVSAAGIHTPLVAAMVGVEVPMRRLRGNVLVSEVVERRINGVLGAGRGQGAGEFSMRQTRAGNILVGPTSDEVEFDRTVTRDNVFRLAGNVARALPALADVRIIRTYAGVRPMPRDGQPIISEVPGASGMVFVVTHSGFTLSVLVGRTVAAHLAGKDDTPHFQTYGLARFDAPAG